MDGPIVAAVAIAGAILGWLAGPVADRIAATRYAPGTPDHDPEDTALAFIAAPSSRVTRIVLAVAAAGAGGVLAAQFTRWEVVALVGALLWLHLVALTIDLQYCRLPDVLTLPAAGLAIAGTAVLSARFDTSFGAAVVGFLGYPGFLLAFGAVFSLLRGKQGIFLGDVKLCLSLGASAGWIGAAVDPQFPILSAIRLVVYAAVIGHALGAIVGLVFVRQLEKPFPFGPGLVAGWFAAVAFLATALD